MIKLNLNEKEKKNLTEEEKEIAMARKLEILILPVLKEKYGILLCRRKS